MTSPDADRNADIQKFDSAIDQVDAERALKKLSPNEGQWRTMTTGCRQELERLADEINRYEALPGRGNKDPRSLANAKRVQLDALTQYGERKEFSTE